MGDELTAAERKKHIEEEATFKATVLSEFKFAREQRQEDKKDLGTKFDRMEKKHTETYISVFEKIEKNGKAIIANQTNIENAVKNIDSMKKKSAILGGGSGLGGGAIMLAIKEFLEGR